MKLNKRFHRKGQSGFVGTKTILIVGTTLISVSAGSFIALNQTSAADDSFSEESWNRICVTATYEGDPTIIAQRGKCDNVDPSNPNPGGSIDPGGETPEVPEVPEIPEHPGIPVDPVPVDPGVPTPTPTPSPSPTPTPTPTPTPEPKVGKMVATYNTNLAPNCRTITLPIIGLNGTIDWDGRAKNKSLTRTFSDNPGEITIVVEGTFSGWGDIRPLRYGSETLLDNACLVSIDSWKDTGTTDLSWAFSEAYNLRHVEEIPDTTTSLAGAFFETTSAFTIGDLDTANVVDMGQMFRNAIRFNGTLDFNTSKVQNFSYMLAGATSFNQLLSLDSRNANDMSAMLWGATSFNKPVNLNTEKVWDLSDMFHGATKFNQPINFNTSNVLDMSYMFANAETFNRPLSFDTSKVSNFDGMFMNTYQFNQDIRQWNVYEALSMDQMFDNARMFNQDLSYWGTENVTSAHYFSRNAVRWTHSKPYFPAFS